MRRRRKKPKISRAQGVVARLEETGASYAAKSTSNLITQGWTANEIASFCSVSIRTALRWKASDRNVPYAAAALLWGDLGAFDRQWEGWLVRGDLLISPAGEVLTRADALAAPARLSELTILREEMQQKPRLNDSGDELDSHVDFQSIST